MSISTKSLSSVSMDSRSMHSYASSASSASSAVGREWRSSGRGGSGNIRRKSSTLSNASEPDLDVSEPSSPISGREPVVTKDKSVSVGRGGAGNVYASWREQVPDGLTQTASILSEHAASIAEYERAVIQRRMEERRAAVVSSGRGGSGNIGKLKPPGSKTKRPSAPKARAFSFLRSRSEENLISSSTSRRTSDADSVLGGEVTISHE